MSVTAEQLIPWCQALVEPDQFQPVQPLEAYLRSIPRLSSLADLPRGTPVLIRGDVDAKPGAKIGKGTFASARWCRRCAYGREHGWKQIVFGHIGRKPEGTLKAVAARLGELLESKSS